MAIIKLLKEQYPNKKDVYNLAHYIWDCNKCNYDIGGGRNIISSFTYNPIVITDQFLAVQHGERFRRRLYHLIVNFDPVIDNPNLNLAFKVGQCICNMYPDYQSYFMVHENKPTPHIHIMFNNCPIYPDKPKLTNVFNFLAVQALVDRMIDDHLGIVINRNRDSLRMQ